MRHIRRIQRIAATGKIPKDIMHDQVGSRAWDGNKIFFQSGWEEKETVGQIGPVDAAMVVKQKDLLCICR